MQIRRCTPSERTRSARGRSEPPQPLFIIECTPRYSPKVGKQQHPKPKHKKNSRPEPQGGFWSRSQEAPGQIRPRGAQAKPRAVATAPAGPSARAPGRLHSPPAARRRWARGRQPAAPRGGSPYRPDSVRVLPPTLATGPLPLAITPLHPLHQNFPPSNTQLTPSSPSTQNSARAPLPSPRASDTLSSENRVEGSRQSTEDSG